MLGSIERFSEQRAPSRGRRLRRLVATVWLLVALGACSREAAAPTGPSPSEPAPGNLQIAVTVDGSTARDAIAGLSEITVDVSATAAGALTTSIDFGDGAVAPGPARHVYANAGSFTINCSAVDSRGRAATGSKTIVVKSLQGSWYHAGYMRRVRGVEVRGLNITGYEGRTIRGTYSVTRTRDVTFTGELTPPRDVRITAGAVTMAGTVPDRLYEDGQHWLLQMAGDSADGEGLQYKPVLGSPEPPAPEARLDVRFDSFGSPAPLVGLSPIRFDGSHSIGSGLGHFIEFGDGQFTSEAQATHPVNDLGSFTARLTVVDRFGRAHSRTFDYFTFALGNFALDGWIFGDHVNKFLRFEFWRRRNHLDYEGTIDYGYSPQYRRAAALATLSGERDVHIRVPELGLEFRGHVNLLTPYTGVMIVTQTGGPDHGHVWTLHYDDGPG